MRTVGPYHYKVWVIGEVLDRYERSKNVKRKPESKLFIKPFKAGGRFRRSAYFEDTVIYSVDIDNLISKLESPLDEIIRGRYFEGDVRTFMEDFGISSRREARKLITRAVNRFFQEIENYMRASRVDNT